MVQAMERATANATPIKDRVFILLFTLSSDDKGDRENKKKSV
jgi:hypothetical protein